MTEEQALRQMKQGSQDALAWFIHQYGAYVSTIIYNIIGQRMSNADVEEVSSDVFLALWRSADRISPQSLRSWLGAVARNRTVDFMKKHRQSVPLEHQVIEIPDSAWAHLSQRERTGAVRQALSALSAADREIFFRYYDLAETSCQIAAAMDLNPATVRSRLSRGRAVLREALIQGGYDNEAES